MTSHLLTLALLLACAAGCSGGESSALQTESSADTALILRADDPAAREALDALAEGRPWRATQALAPALRDPQRRTPEIVILAATAAGRWGGWQEVERLLAWEPWVDTLFDGRARTLLARAALDRRADTLAVAHAEGAVLTAPNSGERGVRLVLLARALDRLDDRDSSRVVYARAAEIMPQAAEWLRLRAAGVTSDSAQRAALYGGIVSAVPRGRLAQAEALARERTGDIPGAIRAYERAGNHVGALRLRAVTATADAERAVVRRELVRIVADRAGSADVRTAIEVLDTSFAPLDAAEELAVARSTFRTGPVPRAVTAYQRALSAGQGTPRDRFNYGTLLARLNRDGEAVAQFASVTTPRSLAADAAYQRARSMLRAGQGDVRGALRDVVARFPDDTGAASTALLLLADLATDERRDPAARDAYLSLVRRYPSSTHAPRAAFYGALIAYVSGDRRAAAREWDALRARYPRSAEAIPATYWAGRAWARLGDTTSAHERWRDVMSRSPQSYYALMGARRLNAEPWTPAPAPDTAITNAGVDSAMARIDLLESLGMDYEAGLEYAALVADTATDRSRLLALGEALRVRNQSSRAIQIGTRLVNGGMRDARAYRLMYPVLHRDVLAAEARDRELDPALIAALIRQESSFDPRATSPPGARGLMQVMPSVGRQIANALDYPLWDPALLYQPDVNVQLGVTHMADLFRTYDRLEHILAAYNAGGTRVDRWRTKVGVEDPEVFTERIPFVETRDYVRIVIRNREIYRALYGW
ncbi:MAG TPA: transglycosylase SLT domain-containing protein [Gemmatimonadaceae bacterium]|nr:transglycosylase SLT domain-containing protein [Gemmatimonadaceae bacterium]